MSCPTLVNSAVISALAGFCLVSSAQDHDLTTDVVVSQQIRITNAETDLKNRQQTRSTKTSFGSTTTESMPSF